MFSFILDMQQKPQFLWLANNRGVLSETLREKTFVSNANNNCPDQPVHWNGLRVYFAVYQYIL